MGELGVAPLWRGKQQNRTDSSYLLVADSVPDYVCCLVCRSVYLNVKEHVACSTLKLYVRGTEICENLYAMYFIIIHNVLVGVVWFQWVWLVQSLQASTTTSMWSRAMQTPTSQRSASELRKRTS